MHARALRTEAAAAANDAGVAARDAVAALVPLYSGVLFQVAHAVLRSRADAEDVVQETFLRVLRHGSAALGEVHEMRVWLVRIAWNLALDRARRRAPDQMDREFAEALAAREQGADAAMVEAERHMRVLQEIERLPRRERQALLLSAVDEMSAGEMAAVLGRSESAVRALVFRARTRLKERLGGER